LTLTVQLLIITLTRWGPVDGLSHIQSRVLPHLLTALDGDSQARQLPAETGLRSGLDCAKHSFHIAQQLLDILDHGFVRGDGLIYYMAC
jgi:hypothetical protein